MDKLPVLLVSLAIVGLLFLALREVVCWYWKINRGMALLEEQTKLLKEIRQRRRRSFEHRIRAGPCGNASCAVTEGSARRLPSLIGWYAFQRRS